MKHLHRFSPELAIFIADSADARERLGMLNRRLLGTLGEVPTTLEVMHRVAKQHEYLYLLGIDPEPLQDSDLNNTN